MWSIWNLIKEDSIGIGLPYGKSCDEIIKNVKRFSLAFSHLYAFPIHRREISWVLICKTRVMYRLGGNLKALFKIMKVYPQVQQIQPICLLTAYIWQLQAGFFRVSPCFNTRKHDLKWLQPSWKNLWSFSVVLIPVCYCMF